MRQLLRWGHAARHAPVAICLAVVLAACGAADDARGPDCPDSPPSPPPAPPYSQDPELADRIPDEVAGEELEIQTVCATVRDIGGLTTSDQMLEEVGVTKQDVTIAFDPTVPSGEGFVGVTAWRYAGADESAIRDAFLGMLEEAGIPADAGTVAGKEVHTVRFHVYYVAGDTLYSVLAEEDDVEEVVAALP